MELEDVTFQVLKDVTNGFSEKQKLGEGAYGVVYRVRLGKRLVFVRTSFIWNIIFITQTAQPSLFGKSIASNICSDNIPAAHVIASG